MTIDQLALIESAVATQPDPARPARPNPTNLRDHLIRAGHLTPHGHSRTVRATTCRTCHAPTLHALDADTCAWNTHLDPTPVDQTGELLALMASRLTYDLTRHHGNYQIEPRRPAHIARPRRYPVLAEHRCGAPALPVDHDALIATTAGTTVELPDRPPF